MCFLLFDLSDALQSNKGNTGNSNFSFPSSPSNGVQGTKVLKLNKHKRVITDMALDIFNHPLTQAFIGAARRPSVEESASLVAGRKENVEASF
jgi:hypothetical protein